MRSGGAEGAEHRNRLGRRVVRGSRGPWWIERARPGRAEGGVVERASIRRSEATEDIPLNGRERGEGFRDSLLSITASQYSERGEGFLDLF